MELQWSTSSVLQRKLVAGLAALYGQWLFQVSTFKLSYSIHTLHVFLLLLLFCFNYSVHQEAVWWNSVFSWASLCLENNWFKTICLKLESRMYPSLIHCHTLFLGHCKLTAWSLFSWIGLLSLTSVGSNWMWW